MTLNGTDSKLPSLLLNSHTDVVPVTESKWTYDPFAAEIVDDRIYARGSQDMKSVGMGYLGAIRRLVGKGWKPKRTVHISWVPDEEIGGVDGMKKFVATKDFQNLKVGFALDEGIPSPFNSLLIFNGERIPWWVKVVAIGNAGHGSALLQGTAVERLLRVLEKVRSFRAEQMKRLAQSDNQLRDCGKFTSINITRLQAGSQTNVIPDEAIAHLDIRLSGKDTGEDDMMKLLKDWTDGEGLTFSFEQKNCFAPETSVDKDNPWWSQIHAVLMER
jgi:aminoacylase